MRDDKWYIKDVMNMTDDVLEAKLDLAADIAVGEIKTRTPVLTGNLKGNNNWRRINRFVRRVFNNTEYAIFVEFGTKKQTPQPYMRPGYRASIPKIERLMKK